LKVASSEPADAEHALQYPEAIDDRSKQNRGALGVVVVVASR
jgi:hypothetical protein